MKPNYLVIVVCLGEGGRIFDIRPGGSSGKKREIYVRSAIAYGSVDKSEPLVLPGIYVFVVTWDEDLPTAVLRKHPKDSDASELELFERMVSAGLHDEQGPSEEVSFRPYARPSSNTAADAASPA